MNRVGFCTFSSGSRDLHVNCRIVFWGYAVCLFGVMKCKFGNYCLWNSADFASQIISRIKIVVLLLFRYVVKTIYHLKLNVVFWDRSMNRLKQLYKPDGVLN